MIYKYGIKIRGVSHEKDNVPCQDAFQIDGCGDNMVIAAVADGLGSCEHSDIASQTAVETAVGYCKDNLPNLRIDETNKICDIIRNAFVAVTDAIENRVKQDEGDSSQYFTTLSLAVLINDTLYYGHAGDSGIVALTTEGRFEKVTEQQNDEDGNVFPLHFYDKWIFKKFDKLVCSVLLATDGMLMRLFPFLLKDKELNVHVNFIAQLMDNRCLHFDKHTEEEITKKIYDFVYSPYTAAPLEFNDDDITLAVLVTDKAPGTQPAEYYKEPDWRTLEQLHREEYERLAYPDRQKSDGKDKVETKIPHGTNLQPKPADVAKNVSAKPETKQTENAETDIAKKNNSESPKKGGILGWLYG